jgi:SET domain-containing protein
MFPKSYTYRPLPSGLYIDNSKIEEQGVFTKTEIKINQNLGISHIKIKDDLVRLPLGGFLNHSYHPNCELTILESSQTEIQNFYLISNKKIMKNEELTLDYNDSAKVTKIPWNNNVN